MVVGLELFAERFAEFQNQYVLIGGAACYTAMNAVGADFRATRDLDVVLCLEEMTGDFIKTFWQFVRDGGYQNQQSETGQKQYYRFSKPSKEGFPAMLELFSRVPDQLKPADGSHLTPIPADDDISSLSAILLNDDYYQLIQSGRVVSSGTSIVRAEYLIPLKARAWLDYTKRKAGGETVDSRNIKKHQNDVFRLFTIIDRAFAVALPATVVRDMAKFIDLISNESIELKKLGIAEMSQEAVIAELRKIYGPESKASDGEK